MRQWQFATLAWFALSFHATHASAQSSPAPDSVLQAHPAWGFDPGRRCSNLRVAEDEATATVLLFQVGRTGVPSRVSISASSRSEGLDAAAADCVLKLRFQPAKRLGDGEPIDSWQQLALRWASQERRVEVQPAVPDSSMSKTAAQSAQESAAIASAGKESRGQERDGTHPDERKVAVRVCAGKDGQLSQEPTILHSSRNPALDEAAVKIAKSGSAYYRPGTNVDGKPVSGCARVVIEFETDSPP